MALVSTGQRCRAYPDTALQEALPRWIGCQRAVYNAKVTEDRLFASQWRLAQRASATVLQNSLGFDAWLSATDKAAVKASRKVDGISTPLDQQYAQFKDRELTPWLYAVPSQVLRNGAYRWMNAKQRQLKGLAKAPRLRKRPDFDSVLLTSELFRFVEVVHPRTGAATHEIEIGTEKHPVGRMVFKSSRPYAIPATLTVRRTGSGKWFVSFSHEQALDIELRHPHEIAYELGLLSDDDLADATLAFDRNVAANKVADSDGRQYDFKDIEKVRIERKAVHRKRYQRKMARQEKSSKNRAKTKQKLAATYEYGADVQRNFAHQMSYRAVTGPHRFLVFEALQVKQMTKRARAKQDPATGKWLKNGAAAKSALTSRILQSSWGRVLSYTEYKAARRNKLVANVPPHYSSQECSLCGHTHPDNRHGAAFVCQRCGFKCHADENAARVQKKRGIAMLRSGALEKPPKSRKRVSFRKSSVGSDTPELSVEPGISRPEPEVARCAATRQRGVAGCEAESFSA